MSFLLNEIRLQGKSYAWVLLFLSSAVPSSRVFPKDPLTPTQILDAMAARAKAFPPFAMHVEIELFSENPPAGSQHDATYVFEQRHDGERFDSVMSSYSPKRELRQENRRVFTGDRYLYRQSVPEPGRLTASFYSPKKARGDFGHYHLWGAVLHEQLPGDHEPVVSVLREAKSLTLREEMDVVEGFRCHVIEASTDHGEYRLWIDPASEFRIRKAVVRKRPGDRHYGKPIPAEAKGDPFQVTTVDYEISKVQLENVEGHFVPVSETLNSVTTTGDGRTWRSRVVVKRSEVRFRPNFEESAFVMDGIPEGARVENFDPDDFGYGFEWRGGTVSPVGKGPTLLGRVALSERGKAEVSRLPIRFEARIHRLDLEKNTARYGVKVSSRGTFRIENVPPGSYRLDVSVTDTVRDRKQRFERIGSCKREFSVPASRAETGTSPIDLGVLRANLFASVEPGDSAPLFAVRTLDGRPLTLSDYRGKYVLLDFWATWCTPCLEETPNFKSVYEFFGKDPRFVLLALTLDKDPEVAKKYINEEKLPWVQGIVGAESKARDYCRQGIPAVYLVDPSGKIVVKGLRGEKIKEAVERALTSVDPKSGR